MKFPAILTSVSLFLVLLLTAPRLAAQEPVAAADGDDFQVNTYTTSPQDHPAVVAGPSDDFLVVWRTDEGPGPVSLAVRGQRLDSAGSPIGDEFTVSNFANAISYYPAAASNVNRFLVVWSEVFASSTVEGRLFESDGTAVDNAFQINDSGDPTLDVDVSVDSFNGFIVVWSENLASDVNIAGRLVTSTGTPTTNFAVNTYTIGVNTKPSVAALDSLDFVVVWETDASVGDDTSDGSIQARRFTSSGAAQTGQLLINEYTTGKQVAPDVIADNSGGFVVVWSSGEPSVEAYSVQARFFDSSGGPLGSQFQISEPSADDQGDPRIAPISGERFLITWNSETSDGDASAIRGRTMDSTGALLGSEFTINTYTTGAQARPVLASEDGGDVLVVWESGASSGNDGSSTSIQARRFSTAADLGDRVWLDEDADGVQDPEEGGLEMVDVDLLDEQGAIVASTTTDADGLYSFTDVASGDYSLQFADSGEGFLFSPQDVGSDDAADSDVDFFGEIDLFTFLPVDDFSRDAGVIVFTLGDRVWNDLDANGVQDGGEPGMEGVTVELYDFTGAAVAQTQTNIDGDYYFDVDPGDYYLQFIAPENYAFTVRDAASDTRDSDVSASGATVLFTLGGVDDSYDAGLVSTLGSIGDRVWLDDNLNGLQDGGELGAENVSVELFTFAGVSQGTTTTAADGSYTFSDLPPGSYYLAFTAPTGLCFTAQDQGTDDGRDSDVHPVSATTGEIVLGEATDAPSWDAGLVAEASVGNRVWLDDGDGLQAGGEQGIENVTVNLYDPSDALLDTAVTDADGFYDFAPGPGEYYLEFVLPTNTAFAPRDEGSDDAIDSDVFAATGTTALFTLQPGTVDASRDAGIEPATIGNRVWIDSNSDGRQQPDEIGAANVVVRLLGNADSIIATTTTDADGVYGFLSIPSGDYRVEIVLPAEALFTAQNIGGDDLIDSDVDPSTGRTASFSYTAGGASRSHDAGLIIVLFTDSFESGDPSAWSSTIP